MTDLTLAQKIRLLSGNVRPWQAIRDLLGQYNIEPIPGGTGVHPDIPGIWFSDGPRGIVMNRSTCFPVAMARGATWDPELEETVATAMGREARALGANIVASVCVNVLRHPAWGRAQETYGEDPYHLGEMGAAAVRGLQKNVMACVKHFACNSIENARFRVDIEIDERTLREVYLPQFKRCVEAGAASVMSAYNKVNGEFCGENRKLLTDILKDEWGFSGFVMSDFFLGVRDGVKALNAGLDLEMPLTWRFGRHLRRAVDRGDVTVAQIDAAAQRLVTQQQRFAAPLSDLDHQIPACPEHRAMARDVARRAMVLLKNESVGEPVGEAPLLPLCRERIKRLAVIGPNATLPNIGDLGSSKVRPPYVITPLQGICAAAGGIDVVYDNGSKPSRAAAVAATADAVVLCVGYSHREEGEYVFVLGGDRDRLTLPSRQERLVAAVAAANPKTTVVLFAGGPVVTDAWRGAVPALLLAWYPGMEGGAALADLLFGDANPSGRMPCVFPTGQNRLPAFDKRAKRIRYEDLHGQRLLDANGETPAFPLGFGLGYTTFSFGPPVVSSLSAEAFQVRQNVENTGNCRGATVVQVYAGKSDSRVKRPPRCLVGFQRLELDAGTAASVAIDIATERLAYYDVGRHCWQIEPGAYDIYVGESAAESALQAVRLMIA